MCIVCYNLCGRKKNIMFMYIHAEYFWKKSQIGMAALRRGNKVAERLK